MLSVLGALFFAIGLALSIGLHEVGHLLPAKKFGVRVTQYMVGFGPTLWSTRKGETEYGVKAIPLGGYIRMIGMFAPLSAVKPARRQHRFASLIEDTREQALAEVEDGDERRTFYSLSVPKKLAVMFGGPVTNLIIATLLFGGIFIFHGTSEPTTTVGYVYHCIPTSANEYGLLDDNGECPDSQAGPAAVAGLQPEDIFIKVNNHEVNGWSDFSAALDNTAGKSIALTIKRDGQLKDVVITPTEVDPSVADVAPGHGFIGVYPNSTLVKMPITQVPSEIAGMTKDAASSIIGFPASVVKLTANLFSDAPRDPEGPVSVLGVGQISGQIASSTQMTTSEKLLDMTSLLASMNLFLFVFNMVPLLPLDGGHIAGALFEGVRRAKSRLLGRGFQGPSDTARLMPLTYAMSIVLLAFGAIVIVADLIKPLDLFN